MPLAYLLAAALAGLYAWLVVASTPVFPGAIGLDYDALGSDYMVFHTAAALAFRHDLATLYDPDAFTRLLNTLFRARLSHGLEFRPWIYPPIFLIFLAPFGLAPFAWSYPLFQAATAALMVGALMMGGGERGGLRLPVALAVALCPAASISVASGSCSFLVVALLCAGAALLDRRPVLAGIAFGLLAFKPQFAVLAPVVLAARWSWRGLLAAGSTCLALGVACMAWLGPEIWTGWAGAMLRSASGSDPRWTLAGRLWGESVYACVVLLGAPSLAGLAQWGAMAVAAGFTWLAFRQPCAPAVRMAVLMAASLLAAPHSGDYDLVLLLGAATVFLVHLGRTAGRWDWMMWLLCWMAPLVGLPILSVPGRLMPLVTLAVLARIALHARRAVAPPVGVAAGI